jgi:hypothetical protein
MNRRDAFLSLGAAAALVGCSAQSATTTASVTTAVTTAAATVSADLASAVNFYGIAKGIALVALNFVAPGSAAIINGIISAVDALIPVAQQTIAAGVTDVTAAANLVTSINKQAIALTNAAAPAVKVVSNAV